MSNILNILAANNDNGGIKIDPITNPDGTAVGNNVIQDTVGNIISTVVGILGLACVIIIIIGGIQYMTSSGDSGKVKKAKDTILYGVIGMVICVLAFAITQFVIGAINNNNG